MRNEAVDLSRVSVVIPARNEARALVGLLPRLIEVIPAAQVFVVNDGSDDDTEQVCSEHGVNVVTHSYAKGNGAAVKSGARAATGDLIVFMDGDGQHDPAHIPGLVDRLVSANVDMVIGARDRESQASKARWIANGFYNLLASWVTGHEVRDLTSGFRVVRAEKFREFLFLLPNGFSYPTTITMAFYRSGYSVLFEPIVVSQRIGQSHIRLIKDGTRFLLIIFKLGTLYSPLRIFFPLSMFFFATGLGYYGYTLTQFGRFTNMGALLLITALLVFLIGLVSEQITALMYKGD